MLKINEFFFSIQGEGTDAGRPCVFIRLTFCNLRCSYCDTQYSFYEGSDYSIEQILAEVKKYNCKLVEVTGGEPLVQQEAFQLLKSLADNGYEVLLETSGSLPIENVDKRVKIIMDIKTPSSRMSKRNMYENLDNLKPDDEVKFVIGSDEDYQWSKDVIEKYSLTTKCKVLLSSVFDKIQPVELAAKILEDNLDVRFQLQLHKYIWDPNTKGV